MNEAADLKVKQQIVEKIKSSTNILIAVSNNPSVDDLSAALGMAAILNKLDKHATAIFSGTIPPAITFLEPDKIFESSADSLRDFIIALDKEKADHLRYKLEGDVVKIFITPYRTVITPEDLEFSQGEFNVELVLALGVDNQEHLDNALAAHGRILHDVTVATLSAGDQISQLGSLDWRDDKASSLCEMVAGIADALKADKTLLDKQISTALLTGIVAATDRFSNTRTTARVMTTAADLMAAGADQQLIAAKLQESHTIDSIPVGLKDEKVEEPVVIEGGAISIDHGESTLPPDDNFSINHEPDATAEAIAQMSTLPELDTTSTMPVDTMQADDNSTLAPPPSLPVVDYSTSTVAPAYAPEPELEPTPEPNTEPEPVIMPAPEPPEQVGGVTSLPHERVIEPLSSSVTPDAMGEPMLGGTLNATTDQAADEARRELEEQQNKTILSHSYLGAAESTIHDSSVNSAGQTEGAENVDIFAEAPPAVAEPAINLPMPPPVPDFSTLPPPPLPDFTLPPPTMPGMSPLPPQPVADDPSQFKIPGQ